MLLTENEIQKVVLSQFQIVFFYRIIIWVPKPIILTLSHKMSHS